MWKINHNSSRDVHSGTAAESVFSLPNPRAPRLPALQPLCGPWAKAILKREVLKGLQMTLLSQWVTASTESRALLKGWIAALPSRCAGVSPPRGSELPARQAPVSHSAGEHLWCSAPWGQAWLHLGSWRGHSWAVQPRRFSHSLSSDLPWGHDAHYVLCWMQNALLKSCEKYFHGDHSAKASPGSQHGVSKAQQAEGKW